MGKLAKHIGVMAGEHDCCTLFGGLTNEGYDHFHATVIKGIGWFVENEYFRVS